MMLGPFGKGIRKVPFSLVLSQILKDVLESYTGTPPITRILGQQKTRVFGKPRKSRNGFYSNIVLKPIKWGKTVSKVHFFSH